MSFTLSISRAISSTGPSAPHRRAEPQIVESMLGTVRHRRQPVDAHRVLQHRA